MGRDDQKGELLLHGITYSLPWLLSSPYSLFQEILFAGVAKDTDVIVEHCFAHWHSEKQQFIKLTQEILQQQR